MARPLERSTRKFESQGCHALRHLSSEVEDARMSAKVVAVFILLFVSLIAFAVMLFWFSAVRVLVN